MQLMQTVIPSFVCLFHILGKYYRGYVESGRV